jgi:TatD DNase family protein
MDAHTHRAANSPHIYVLSQEELLEQKISAAFFCAGIHPWHVESDQRESVRRWAKDPRCVALGETGLDRLYPHWERQLAMLNWHWDLAEELQKPLVLHIVRSSSDLLQLMKRRRPRTPWLWHDFSGPLEAVPRLLKLHPMLYFSCGPRFFKRPQALKLWQSLPVERRLLETDDSGVDILEVYAAAETSWSQLKPNFLRLFPTFVV